MPFKKKILASLKEKLIKLRNILIVLFLHILHAALSSHFCLLQGLYVLHIFAWVVHELEYVVTDFLVSMHKLYVKL